MTTGWEKRTVSRYEQWSLETGQRVYWLWRKADPGGLVYRWRLTLTDGQIIWIGSQHSAFRRPPFREAERQIARWERDRASRWGAQ